MSGCGGIHICRGVNRRYRAVVRVAGHRKWQHVGPWRKSYTRAANEMFREFLSSGVYKRGSVWFIADYYDPISVLDVVKP